MNILNAVKTIFSTERQASYASSSNGVPTVVIDGTNNGQGDGCMKFSTLASVLGEQNKTYHFYYHSPTRLTTMTEIAQATFDYVKQNAPINPVVSFCGVVDGTSTFKLVWGVLSFSGNEYYGRINVQHEGASAFSTFIVNQNGLGENQVVATNIPDFYKSYQDLSSLASALGATMLRRSRQAFSSLSTLQSAVADQNLEKYGLAVGDYITINGYDYVIAGLNVMKGTSTPYRVSSNHVGLIVIPHTTHAWNESGNTYTGADNRGAGYKNSDLHYYLKNTILPHVQNDLGSSNLISHSKLLSNAVNTSGINRFGEASGCSSSWDWEADCYISALSEVQVYGSVVWSSSGFDSGEACRQLDVFRRFNMNEIFGGEYPWLRDVVSSSYAATVDTYGRALYDTASYAYYVAGLILFH